jgi:TonB C terminal
MESRPPSQRKRTSTKVDLIVSLTIHALVFFFVFIFAAREGVLGTRLKEITVAIVPEEKPPPEPEKPPPPVVEPPKEEPKIVENAPPPPISAPPPVQTASAPAPVAVAPAPVVPADFNFNDGAKEVITGTNGAALVFKSQVEYLLRSNWERPSDLEDDGYVAEVELSLDSGGHITNYVFKKKSGNPQWDDSVARAMAATKIISLPQPKGFNGKFLVRFDVLPATTDLLSH